GILYEQPAIPGTVIQQLNRTLHELTRRSDVIVGNVGSGFVAEECKVAIRCALVANVELVVLQVAAEAQGVGANGLAERIADSIGVVRLEQVQPVVADTEAVKEQHRQRGGISG